MLDAGSLPLISSWRNRLTYVLLRRGDHSPFWPDPAKLTPPIPGFPFLRSVQRESCLPWSKRAGWIGRGGKSRQGVRQREVEEKARVFLLEVGEGGSRARVMLLRNR